MLDIRKKAAWPAAFYLLALAAQVSGYTSASVALALAIIATLLLVVPFSESLQNAARARGFQVRKPWESLAAEEWLLPTQAAERFAPPDLVEVWRADPATHLHRLLLSGGLIARGTPHYGGAGSVAVLIGRGEWQTLRLAGANFSSAGSSVGPANSYDNIEISKRDGR